MNWFESWFDSKYYHILYKKRNDKEAQTFIKNLFNYLNLTKDGHLLDLACGKGRHSKFINELGYRVTGLDLSENSIEFAKKSENNTLKFNVWDMRNVYKTDEFNGIFNFFTSFGYFTPETNLTIFKAIYKQLKQDGVFVIDFMNAKKVVANLVANEIKNVDGIQFIIERFVENQIIHKNIKFNAEGKEFQFQEKVRIIELEDFLSLAKTVGFKHITSFGDYNLNEFNQEESNRLILIFKKE